VTIEEHLPFFVIGLLGMMLFLIEIENVPRAPNLALRRKEM
jgi:hypothetical protein